MQEHLDRDELASERLLLSANRTFSAWIWTGLAGVGGGLAVARLLIHKSYEYQVVAQVIRALLVMWGASIFIYSIIDYRRTYAREIAGYFYLPFSKNISFISSSYIWDRNMAFENDGQRLTFEDISYDSVGLRLKEDLPKYILFIGLVKDVDSPF